MRSFLCKGKSPIIKWGMLPDETYYEGEVPEGYSLAISPSEGYVVIDVDKHGDKNGFDHIPYDLKEELYKTLNYPTKNKGSHHWFKYTGNQDLANKASGLGIDLRVGKKGYVIWYKLGDFRSYLNAINETSPELNTWLESLFGYVNK